MWTHLDQSFSTPPPTRRNQRSLPSPMSERKRMSTPSPVNNNGDIFHVIHKVPSGDSPYVRAKHVQLIDKDPSRAVSMFWAAINAGDRVDSALKDMAVVMKQLERSDEAIEAVKSFRHLCPCDSQESLDNVLLELYKRSGRIEEEIELLQNKLKKIEEGITFGGGKTKIARSQGKKIHITIEQERSRVLGNLGWAYLQQNNYEMAEQYYRRALSLGVDKNKQCNLAICLMHMNRITEAKSLLQAVSASAGNREMDSSYARSFECAIQMLAELESPSVLKTTELEEHDDQENQRSFAVTGSTREGQNHVSTFSVCKSLAKGHGEQTVLLIEQDKSPYRRNHHENKPPRLFGYDKVGFTYKDRWLPTGSSNTNLSYEETVHSVRSYRPVLFTHPRRMSSREHNMEFHRRAKWEGKPVGHSFRKLTFEQAITSDSDKTQAILIDNGELLVPSEDEIGLPNSENVVMESGSQHILGGTRKRNTCGNGDDQDQLALEESISTTTETSVDFDKTAGGISTSIADQSNNKKSDIMLQFIAEKPKSIQDCFTTKDKKSWADMVEEEENEEQDENLNSNVVYPSYCPENQIDCLSQKFESLFDLKDGYATPRNAAAALPSSRNPKARRSLYFDQQQRRQESKVHFYSYPLPNKGLNFGSYNSAPGKMRRNRLQVFQDITPFSDSP